MLEEMCRENRAGVARVQTSCSELVAAAGRLEAAADRVKESCSTVEKVVSMAASNIRGEKAAMMAWLT